MEDTTKGTMDDFRVIHLAQWCYFYNDLWDFCCQQMSSPLFLHFCLQGVSCFARSSHGALLQHSPLFRAQLSPLMAFSHTVRLPDVSPCVSFLLCMKCTANSCLCSVYFMVSCLLFGVLRALKSSMSYFLL